MKSVFNTVLMLLTIASTTACSSLGKPDKHLKLLHKYKLKIPEPSGLSFSSDGKSLWSVSDRNSSVYNISLKGKTKSFFKISENDLEGITIVNDSLNNILMC